MTGDDNPTAAATADLIVIAFPWDADADAVSWLKPHVDGKVVISCVNPLGFDKNGPFGLGVEAGSAAEHFERLLPGAKLVGAFHHVAAPLLLDLGRPFPHDDVLVASDHADALRVTCGLATAVSGRQGIDVGTLRMCRVLEPWTAVLISVNRLHSTHAGVTLTNVDGKLSKRLGVNVSDGIMPLAGRN